MARTSLVHYIAPPAISLTPNCNSSANDIAVYIARGAKIRVFSDAAGIKMNGADYQEWTLTGRNRRLADSSTPYTIYARLSKTDFTDGYLVFVKKQQVSGVWKDKYPYVIKDAPGLYQDVYGQESQESWYIRLGDVSLPVEGQREITLDTGILGTPQYNEEWNLNPDSLPLRVEIGCTIGDEDAGPTPYVFWGQRLVLNALLVEGWESVDSTRLDHWEIQRNADTDWPDAQRQAAFASTGIITLSHSRGSGDDFQGAVQTVFTVTAWGYDDGDSSGSQALVPLGTASICILSETVETFDLVKSSEYVNYNPMTGSYVPASGVDIGVRATDQKGDVFDVTVSQFSGMGLQLSYAPVGSEQWTALAVSGQPEDVAMATVPISAFLQKQSINVRLTRTVDGDSSGTPEVKELRRSTIAFVSDGEDSANREWIYKQDNATGYDSKTGTAHGEPVSGKTGDDWNADLTDDFVPTGWSDNALAVSALHPDVYTSWRDYDQEHDKWGDFNAPVLWSHWGDQGTDGDGVQYLYKLFDHELTDAERINNIPQNPVFDPDTKEWEAAGWHDDPQAPTQEMQFCYCSVIQHISGQWGSFQKLGLWSKWSQDGADGATCFLERSTAYIPVDTDGVVLEDMEMRIPILLYVAADRIPISGASLQEGGQTHYATLLESIVTSLDAGKASVSGHKVSVSDVTVSSHKAVMGSSFIADVSTILIRVAKGDVLDEHIVGVTVEGSDEAGISYTAYAALNIQGSIIAKDGESTAMCILKQQAVFVETDTSKKVSEAFDLIVPFKVIINDRRLAVSQATLSEEGTPHYASLHGGTVSAGTHAEAVSSHKVSLVGSVTGHKLSVGSGFIAGPSAIRIKVSKNATLDEHLVGVTVIAIDTNGKAYSTYASLNILANGIGRDGEDGKEREWVYKLSNTNPGTPDNPTDRTIDDYVPSGWSDNPSSIDADHRIEWGSWRDFNHTTKRWGDFHAPVIWAQWGERGQDGDGVEYVFVRTTTNSAPTITDSSSDYGGKHWYDDDYLPLASAGRCTDDPVGADSTYQFEWVAKRSKTLNSDGKTRTWQKYSGTMALWANWGKKGDKGDPGDPGEPGSPGSPGKDGKDGKDAATLIVSPSNITYPANPNGSASAAYSVGLSAPKIMINGTKYDCTTFTVDTSTVSGVTYTSSGRTLTVSSGASPNGTIIATGTYTSGGTTWTATIAITIGPERKRAIVRGPKVWQKNTQYYSGQIGESYLDIVVYEGKYYQCVTTHTSGTTFDSSKFQEATEFGFIASGLILSEQALIRNLVVEELKALKEEGVAAGNLAYGTYSAVNPGVFEIGTYQEVAVGSDKETNYQPRYEVTFQIKNGKKYPVLTFYDESGNKVGDIDESIFANVETVQDSWNMMNLIFAGSTRPTHSDYNTYATNPGNTFYQFFEGYNKNSGTGVYTYTFGLRTGASTYDRTQHNGSNGRWQKSMDGSTFKQGDGSSSVGATGNGMRTGYYVKAGPYKVRSTGPDGIILERMQMDVYQCTTDSAIGGYYYSGVLTKVGAIATEWKDSGLEPVQDPT